MSDTITTSDNSGGTTAASAPLPRWPGSGLQRMVSGIDQASFVIIVAAMICMSILVVAQVFWRHVLGSSIDSADELSRLFFVWAMFLAVPHGIKYGVHVGIDLVISYLPPKNRNAVFRFTSAAGCILMVTIFIASWIATGEKWQQLMPTLPITSAVFYICILISSLHSILHLVLYAWGGPSIWGGRGL